MSVYRFDGSVFQSLDWREQRALRWAAWRPDGAVLLAVGNGGSVLLSDGELAQTLASGSRQNLRGAAWSPDGRTALLVGNRGVILRLRGEVIDPLPDVTSENLRRVAWHPGGEYALVAGNAGTLLRYDAGSGLLQHVPGDRAHTLRSLAFRPDGAYALVGAYASRYAGYPRPQPLYRCDGRYLQALLATDDEDDFVSIDWSASSQALVTGYAWRPDGSLLNKALIYDGATWQTFAWPAKSVVLGGAWRPGRDEALLVGESGLALGLLADGTLRPLASGTQDNLVGPFWRPDGEWALVLKGPAERVYTV